MLVNEELIAAYIDGNVTTEERNEVRRYLSAHPAEQDLVLSMMDDCDTIETEEEQSTHSNVISIQRDQSFGDIAYAAAAFAPQMQIAHPQNDDTVERFERRRSRMAAFLDELQNED